jgi:uncharacterized protein YkwD
MKNLHLYSSGFLLIIALFLSGCQTNNQSIETTLLSQPTQSATPLPTLTPIPILSTPVGDEKSQVNTSNHVVISLPAVSATQLPPKDPIQTSPPEPTPQQPVDCLDEAAYYADVTIPDGTRLEAGEPFTKTWQVRNTGTCPWGEGYMLVFASGDIMGGALTNPLPDVAPGEIVNVSVNLIAPARGGEHTGNWEFQNSQGSRFGVGSGSTGYIWVQIQVAWSAANNNQPSDSQPVSPIGASANCPASEDTGVEMQILTLINTARAEQGLSELSVSSALQRAAMGHSLDMACQDFIDHVGSDGSTWYDRAASQGYANANSAHENIYVGDPTFGGTAEGAFSWWMNSQVHRDNILFPAVSEIGIGYVYNPNSTYGGYFTVLFARP